MARRNDLAARSVSPRAINQGGAKGVVGNGGMGLEFDGPRIGLDGRVDAPLGDQGVGQIVMGFGGRRANRYGPFDEPHGVVEAAELLRQGAQQVEGVGLVGLGHKDAPVGGLGLGQPAGLMVGKAL